MLLPSDNVWDVPSLRLDRQGVITTPVVAWGSVSRRVHMPGTWVFYVDDYRFGSLLRDPLQLVGTGCTGAAELNVTLYDLTPRVEALNATYQKRRAARLWQDAGLSVFVDVNVPERFYDVAMLGVPVGWTSFATRGYALRPDDLRTEHRLASGWAGPGLTLLVYGGGQRIEALCRELTGCVYVPAHMDQVRGKGTRSDRGASLEGGEPE